MASSSSGADVNAANVKASPSPSATSMANSTASTEKSTSVLPTAATAEKVPDDSSKLKTFLGILRKFIGVSDIASDTIFQISKVCGGLPTNKVSEYWNYLDRPEMFISIGDSDDELGRMLAVLRFWFTKDLKYVKGKPCKPYNSTLGEFFRCNWEVEDTALPVLGNSSKPAADSKTPKKLVKVSFLTEQTSHHPPVSGFFIDCPEKGIIARGFDQLSAKFTGTSIRVIPGAHNLGIFITVQSRDNEEYQLTHPAAHLGGLMRGVLSVSVADTCTVSCPKTGLRVILHYMEEGWLGKSQNKVVGIIYKYNPSSDKITRLKDVPEKDIVGRIEGSWREQIFYTLLGQNPSLLLDLNPLYPAEKIVPPESVQLTNESRRFWSGVTQAINNKQFGLATKLKQELEERQRERAAERKAENLEWSPRFFTGSVTPIGKPELTDEGRAVLKGLQEETFELRESAVVGA